MSAADFRQASSHSHTYLLVPIVLLFALLVVAQLRAPTLISNVGLGSAIIVAAPLILATYALTIVAMAGRAGVDLSIGPLIGFINVGMIQLFAAEVISTPVEFFLYAIAVGILYQILFGLIVVYIRVQPIIVALAGYLALVGLNLVILPRPGGLAPDWMMPWGLGTSIWSPVLAILVLATLAWFVLTRTAFFGHLRLMGADERTAFSAGVRINVVRLGAHVIAGIYSALAALTFTSLISSGDPTQGTTYTLMAVTALVLGGTSLAGGRGSIIGSLLGAINIYLITYVLSTFSFGMVQSFVTDAAYGVVLVVSLLLTLVLPRLPSGVRRISPLTLFVMLGIVAVGVILYSKDEIIAAPQTAESSGMTVLGGDESASADSGLTVLGGDESASSESGLTVLGGDEGSGLTVLGGDEAPSTEETAPRGTPIVYAAIIIAVVAYLIYLLYRRVSVALVVLIGVLILLVLGLSFYDGLGPAQRSLAAGAADASQQMVLLFEPLELASGPPGLTLFGAEAAGFAPPVVNWLLVAVGTVLVSSLLIVLTLPKVRTRVGNIPLLFLLGLGVAAVIVIVYANQGVSTADGELYSGALAAVLIAALLFVVSLPRVESRIRNLSLVLFAVLSVTALAAMFFAGGSAERVVELPGGSAATALGTVPQMTPSATFLGGVFWVVLAAGALFILTLPAIRRRIVKYAIVERGTRVFSYTGGFIVGSAVLAMAAMFYAAKVPLWKLGVALVAAAILWRYGWRFLRRYRGGNFLALAGQDFQRRRGERQAFEAKR